MSYPAQIRNEKKCKILKQTTEKKSINQNLLEDPLEENGKKKRAIWGSPSKKTGSLGASGREGDPDRPEWLDNKANK